jgi:tyrosyl-tRNA synthetase
VEIPRGDLERGIGVLTAFVRAGLVSSTSDARRQVQAGALRVNDDAVRDEKRQLTLAELGPEGVIKLSHGKKKHVLVRPSND